MRGSIRILSRRSFLKVRELYQKEGGKFPDPILKLTWAYTNPQHPSLVGIGEGAQRQSPRRSYRSEDAAVTIKKGQQLPGFAWLKDDGTTACGNWIYSRMLDGGRKANACAAARKIHRDMGIYPELGMVVAGESPRAL